MRIKEMSFDYAALGELYPSRSFKRYRGHVGYKRFRVAAEAIRFAMEELPTEFLSGTWLEVAEERYDGRQIRALYDHGDYPLTRKPM
jgi:hypothetical protein